MRSSMILITSLLFASSGGEIATALATPITTSGPQVSQLPHSLELHAGKQDRTACAKAKGVQSKCLEYAIVSNGVPTNYLDYLFCVQDFGKIRDCFLE